MEMFYGMDLPQHVKESLESVDGEILEELLLWGKTKEELVEHIEEACLNGLILITYQDNISLLFMDKTPYTLQMTILPGDGAKSNKITRLLMETLTMYKEKCDIHKIEIRNTCPSLWKILNKAGFQTEGTLVDSRRLSDETYIDELSMGYLIDV